MNRGFNTATMFVNESVLNDTSQTPHIIHNGSLQKDTAARVIDTIVLPTICVFGIVGIILTLVVLSRKNMATSTNCYMMGLAVADLIFLVLFIVLLIIKLITRVYPMHYYIASVYPTYAPILMNMFLLASIWQTVMLAIERDIAISQPFLATRLCNVKKARIICSIVYITACIIRLPNFWENKLVSVFNGETNSSVVYMEATELAYDPQYNTIYPWTVDVIIASVLPFSLLLLLNVHLIWEVHKSTKYMENHLTLPGAAANIQREELHISIMLISVIIVFFICQAPYVIYTAIASINAFQTSVSIFRFRYIAMVLLTLKSAINFILYCWFSEKFWTTLKCVCCIRLPQREERLDLNPYQMCRQPQMTSEITL